MKRTIPLILIFAAFILTGCGRQTSQFIAKSSEVVEAIETDLIDYNPADFPDITREDAGKAPSIAEITQKELAEASKKELQAILAKNYGAGFRDAFQISPEKVLTEEDWKDIKGFLYFQKFQTFIYTDEDGNEIPLMDTSKEKEYLDAFLVEDRQKTAAIKEARDFIDAMSKEEFLARLCEATIEELDLSEEEEEIYLQTLSTITDDELTGLKESVKIKLEDTIIKGSDAEEHLSTHFQ